MRLKQLLTSAIVLFVFFINTEAFAQKISSSKAAFFRKSPPLTEMIKNAKKQNRHFHKENRNELEFEPNNNGRPGPDPLSALQRSYRASRTPLNGIINFDGVDNIDGVAPPDTSGDVSPNHYMQCVNNHTAIYDRNGNTVIAAFPTSDFWQGTPYDDRNDGDAVILWDEDAQRWLVTQFYIPQNGNQYLLIAVSQTDDPTGNYYQYAFQYQYMPDYPKWAIWPDGYYMGANAFNQNNNYSYEGVYVSAFERDKILVGDANAQVVTFGADPNLWSVFPADADAFPPAGTPCPFMSDQVDNTNGNNEVYIYEFHVDWNNTGNSTFNQVNTINVADYGLFNSDTQVPQQGVNQKLDLLHSRIMYRPYFRHFDNHESLLMTRTVNDNGVAAIRWYEFRDTGGGWSLYQQGTYNPGDGIWRWMPSIAMNENGDIALGYSISGNNNHPSIRCVGRYSNDALGTMTTDETEFFTGNDSQDGVSRWGDYSMVSVDPTDNTSFWFTTEYTTGGWNWRTRIIHFDLPVQCTPPSTQASNFVASNIGDNQADISWTRGNGDRVIVVAHEAGVVNTDPSSGTSYNANANFGNGDEIGNGNYVVYNGTGTSVTVTGLTAGTQYYFAVYEYFDADKCYNINELTGDLTTTGTPPCSACYSWGNTNYQTSTTRVIFNTIDNSSGKSTDSNGNAYSDYTNISTDVNIGDSYDLTVHVNTDGNYTVATKIWIDWNQDCDFDDAGEEYDLGTAKNVSDGATSNSPLSITVPSSALTGNTIMRVSSKYSSAPGSCDTDFDGEVEDYTVNVVSGCTGPSTQATNFGSANITASQMDISWTRGNGDYVLVVARQGSAVNTDPSNGTTYTANANFASGDEIGTANYVVYNGTGTSITVTGLNSSTTYYFAIYEYNSADNCYNLTELTGNETTDCTAPSTQATNFAGANITDSQMDISWTRGNGDRVLVVAKQGSAVDTDPSKGNSYNANANFGSGDEIGTGNYVVYDGTGTSVTVTGLNASTTYYFAIYEYDSSGYCYNTNELTGNETTDCSAPSTQATNFGSANITASQMDISWTRGNGDNVLVVAHQGSAVDTDPSKGTSYTANANFGSGDEIGTANYVVYNGTGSSVTVTGLNSSTTYYFAIYEYNSADNCYNLTELTGNETTICNEPTNQATDFASSNIGDNQADVSWTRGNGDNVLVVAHEAGAVDTDPTGGTAYTANANFGSGDEIGTGNFVVYNGTGSSVTVTGLTAGTQYYFAVYEYNSADNCYNLNELTGNLTTTGNSGCTVCYSYGNTDYDTSTTRIIFNTIDNSSGKPTDANGNAYSDYTSISTNVFKGTDYDLTVQVNTDGNWTVYTKVWIDWNQDCDFDDAGEEYDLGTAKNVSDGATSNSPLSITVPSSALTGNTIMRVSTNYYSAAGSCDIDFDGEVEDYTVIISDYCYSYGNTDWETSTTRVVFNTIDNTSGKPTDANGNAYSDYTGLSTTVYTDNSYDLTVQVNTDGDYTTGTVVWIDWNQDSDFDDEGEEYNLGTATNVSDGATSNSPLSVTVPIDAATGKTIMRVSTQYNAYPTSCDTGYDGEVEDYTIEVKKCNGTTTTWDGIAWNNGIPDKNTAAVINGNYNSNTGNIECCSLTINAGYTVTVNADNYILAKYDFENNGTLEVLNNGAFVQRADDGQVTGNGNYIVHRTSPDYNDYDYIYWASPLDNETIGNALGESPASFIYKYNTANFLDLYSGSYPQTTGNPDTYDDNGDDWSHVSANEIMQPGVGYIAMGKDSEIPFDFNNIETNQGQAVTFNSGKVNNGIIQVPVYLDKYHADGLSGADNYHTNSNLVGNPYPSAIDIVKLRLENLGLLSGTFSVWTHDTQVAANSGPNAYDYTTDDYATIAVDENGVFSETASSSGTHASRYIASGQGFNADVTANGTLNFKNDMRVTGNNNNFLRPAISNMDKIWLNLTGVDTSIFRQIYIGFHNLATDDYVTGQDAQRIENGNNTDFYSLIPNHNGRFAIQNLNTFNTDKTIPLGIEITQAGNYEISIDNSTGVFTQGQNVYLLDLQTGITHNLSQSPYRFHSDIVNNDNRFVLKFVNGTSEVEQISTKNVYVFPNPSENIFNIVLPVVKPVEIVVFDISGKRILTTGNTRIDLSKFASGIYYANITVGGKTITKKLILK